MLRAKHISALLVCLLFWSGLAAQAETEVHIVAVGRGYQTDDTFALPEAGVIVDRPGKEVALVLLDGGAVHWHVEATPGTLITDIVRGGRPSKDSKVSFLGVPMDGVGASGLPLVFRPLGRDFRNILGVVTARFGTDRIHGFQGTHRLRGRTLNVDAVDQDALGYRVDYISVRLGQAADLPQDIQDWLAEDQPASNDVSFTNDGVVLNGPDGTSRYPASADVPDIFLPAAAVHEPSEERVYALSYGGEGYIYAIDTKTGEWSVVTSLNRYDAVGLLYDAANRQFITTGAFSRPGEIRIFDTGGQQDSVFVPTTAFPGLTDLFNYGNEHGPPLTPLVFQDGWLLAEARNSTGFRIYAIEITSGEVRLLRFQDD